MHIKLLFLPQIGDGEEDSACIKVVEGKDQNNKTKQPKRGTGEYNNKTYITTISYRSQYESWREHCTLYEIL